MHETRRTLFSNYAINLSQTHSSPLKDHPQLPLVVNILSRLEQHHLLLTNCVAKKVQLAFIASLQHYFTTQPLPTTLQSTRFIYFDLLRFDLTTKSLEAIEQDFYSLCTEAHAKDQKIIFIMPHTQSLFSHDPTTPSGYLGKLLYSILAAKQWRLILLAQDEPRLPSLPIEDFFTVINFIEPTHAEKIAILKSLRTTLEEFHQVTLVDELFPAAYDMASYYLPNGSSLDCVYTLLDSAAAHASAAANPAAPKPIVSTAHLASALTNQTPIPLAHLQNPHFHVVKFIEALKQRIYGHDTAIQAIGSLLQTAYFKLFPKPGTLCNFLLAGPPCVGKTALAEAMADYLFGYKNALLRAHFAASATSLQQLKVTVENRCLNLLTAVAQKPYAILFLENIEQYPLEFHENLNNVLTQGYMLDSENKKIDFHNIIIVMTTTLGADRILNLTHAAPEKNKTLDLLQLVLNDSMRDLTHPHSQQFSLTELRDEILPTITTHFSAAFLQRTHLIPFVPLDYVALEKIMHTKIKILTKHLLTQHNIELTYVPEIIKFLAQEALWQRMHIKSLDTWLEQHLYSCITHEIVAQREIKGSSNQLLVQLNESGQSLHCEFIHSNEFYSLP